MQRSLTTQIKSQLPLRVNLAYSPLSKKVNQMLLAFAQSTSGKICLNLLNENNQLESWFAPFAVIVAIAFAITAFRTLNKAKSHARVSAGTVAGLVIVCIVLLVCGWGAFQFFDPTC